jgi:hypothetical protein
VHQEVMLELPSHHKDYTEQLLDLRVPYLSILHDLADKVHGLLLDLRRGFWLLNGDNGADVATYNNSTSSSFGGTSVGKNIRYCLSSMKVVAA